MVARRPPKIIPEIGTPSGTVGLSSRSTGLLVIGHGEAAVGMGGRPAAARRPTVSPAKSKHLSRRIGLHSFPPHVAVTGSSATLV